MHISRSSEADPVRSLMAATFPDREPEVGLGATVLGWADRYAATIISFEEGRIAVREDRATRSDGGGATVAQTYDYSPDPNGLVHHFAQRNGQWQEVRRNPRTQRWEFVREGYGLRIGARDHFYDFAF